MCAYKETLADAEKFLRMGSPRQAIAALEQALAETPEEEREAVLPRMLFDRGNAALLNGDINEALDMYRRSIEAGNDDHKVPINMAGVLDGIGEYSLERDILEAAVEMDMDPQSRRMTFQALHGFYLRREMPLKAQRTAERYIEEHEDEYFGRHLQFVGLMAKRQYDEARQFLDGQRERFGADPLYLRDRLDWFERQKMYRQELEEMDGDPVFMQAAARMTLQRRLSLYLTLHDGEGARRTAQELFVNWGDDRGSFTQMVLAAIDGDFYKAAATADYILKTHAKEPGQLFYMTLYVDQIILWRLCKGKPTDSQRATMERAMRSALEWFSEHGMADERLLEPLRRIGFDLEMPPLSDNG